MFLLLGGQHVPGLPFCGCGGGHRHLVGSQLAPLQPEEDYPPAVGQPPVSVIPYEKITQRRKGERPLYSYNII